MDARFLFLCISSFTCFLFLISLFIGEPATTELFGLNAVNTFVTSKYIWNLITSSFYEVNAIKILLDIAFLYFITSNLQPTLVVNEQFMIYLVVCMVIGSFSASLTMFYKFYSTGISSFLTESSYGLGGMLMALCMYLRLSKGNAPLHPVLLKIPFHFLPSLFAFGQMFLRFVGVQFLVKDVIFTVMTYFISWSYLRFYFKFEVVKFIVALLFYF